jgi:ribosomal protein S18 acetylase RimI-like enzyme
MEFKIAPQEQCVLRQARKDDARHVAELIVIAGDQKPNFPYVPECKGDGPIDLAWLRSVRRDESFAIRHSTIAEINGQVAGVMLGYKLLRKGELRASESLAPCLRPVMDPGPDLTGAFYVNTLSIYPPYQKHGLGARLLDKANQKALKSGCSGVSLEVMEDNLPAARFYARQGFKLVKRRAGGPGHPEPYQGDIAFLWRPVSG